MQPSCTDERLSRISTQWALIEQAHGRSEIGASELLAQLMQRYCGAAYRYLLGALHNDDAAMELFQEFALRFVRGDFRHASAERGRFRDYLKSALRHLVTDYHRQRQAAAMSLPAEVATPAPTEEDEDFLQSWREELLSKSWQALAEEHPDFHAVLLARVQDPDAASAELAERLKSGPLIRAATPGNVRVILHRARYRFAELLVNLVSQSLGSPTKPELLEELRTLRLFAYCRPALNYPDSADTSQ